MFGARSGEARAAHFGERPVKLLDIGSGGGAFLMAARTRGYDARGIEVDPEFLTSDYHEHDDDVTSFVWKDPRPMHMEKIETFLSLMVQNYGEDLLRYKGVLNIQGEPRRMIFQGVHMLMGGTPGKPWEPAWAAWLPRRHRKSN